MRLLLDSHILLRLDVNPSLVPESTREILSDLSNQVYISAATAWELGIKQSKGKLKLAKPVSAQASDLGFLALPITFEHAERAAALPMLHGDPFDRMLVAQALVKGLTLVTADRRLAEYPVPLL